MKEFFWEIKKNKGFEKGKFEEKDSNEIVEKIIREKPFIQKILKDIRDIDEGTTLRHLMEVAEMVVFIEDDLDFSQKEKELLICAALTHDIGKKFINEEVLNKKEKYDEADVEEMEKHIRAGFDYLMKEGAPEIAEIVVRHHQHKNRPRDKKNEKRVNKNNIIYLEKRKADRRQDKPEYDRLARIISIVDIIQATGDSARPYNHMDEAFLKRKEELSVFDSPEEKRIIALLEEREKKLSEEKFRAVSFQKAA